MVVEEGKENLDKFKRLLSVLSIFSSGTMG
jgi:hypothetical protein